MPFDMGKYKAAGWVPRTSDEPVPELKDFFGEEEPAVWTVRGLTATEMAKAKEAVQRSGKALANLIAAFAYAADDGKGKITGDIKNEMQDMVPGSLVLRYELLVSGSVSPAIDDKQDAVALGRNHPNVLERLTEKILELTGEGSVPGKQTPCGGTTGSEPH